MSSLCSLQGWRERGLIGEIPYSKAIRDSDVLIRRLARTRTLQGHTGCVNTIAWNESGTRLLSGADDCHLNIFEPGSGKLKQSFRTLHPSNIFSAKFLPNSDGCKTVSCAGIGTVEYSLLSPLGDYVGHTFHCQSSVTYQVATLPANSNEFLTCEEKGFVRLFDLRVKTSCNCDGCNKDVIYGFPFGVTSLAVHPLAPHYLACAVGDGSVRLLDRRMLDAGRETGSPGGISPFETADRMTRRHYQIPTMRRPKPYKITSIQFNPTGSELLVSYSEDYLYLFNSGVFWCGGGGEGGGGEGRQICRPTYLSHCETYPGRRRRQRGRERERGREGEGEVRSKPKSGGFSSEPSLSAPPALSTFDPSSASLPALATDESVSARRLRLRGDWSDTGPEARPEGQETEETREDSLMSRMSQMFARWIDAPLGEMGAAEEPPSLTALRRERARETLRSAVRRRRERRDAERRTAERGELEPLLQTQRHREEPSADSAGSKSDESFNLFSDSDADQSSTASPTLSREAPLFTLTGTEPHTASFPSHATVSTVTSFGEVTCAHNVSETTPIVTPTFCSSESPLQSQPLHRPGHTVPYGANHTPLRDQTRFPAPSPESQDTNSDSRGPDPDSKNPNPESWDPSQDSRESIPGGGDGPIEHQTSRVVPMPAINIVEGETDSDDLLSCDEQQASCDWSGDPSGGGGRGRETEGSRRWEEGGEEEGEEELVEKKEEIGNSMAPFMVYKGHRNARTMIKQANFWGENWVLSGSDCGRMFVWDKWTGEVVNLLVADSHVVNCIQPHPEQYVVATSGIDYDVKLWEPMAAEPCCLTDLDEIVQRNEVMLQMSRNTITVPSTFVLRILSYLSRRRRAGERESDSDSD